MDTFTISLWVLLSVVASWFGFIVLISTARLLESLIFSSNQQLVKNLQRKDQILAFFHISSFLVQNSLSVILVFAIYWFLFMFLIPVAPVLNFILAAFAIQLSWLLYRSFTHKPKQLPLGESTSLSLAQLVKSTSNRLGVETPPEIYVVPFSPWGTTSVISKGRQTGVIVSYHLMKGAPVDILERLILAEQIRSSLVISRFHNLLRGSVLGVEMISMGNLLKVIPRVFDPSFWVFSIQKAFSTQYLARTENDVFEIICLRAASFSTLSELKSARQFMNQRMDSFRVSLGILLRSSCEVHTIQDAAFSMRALTGARSTTSVSALDSVVSNELLPFERHLSLILQEQVISMQTSTKAFRGVPLFTSYSMEMSGQGKQKT